MKIQELDLLHHRMIRGDLQAKEQLKNALEAGVKNKCPIVQDFINRAKREHEKNKPYTLKPSFLARHRQAIIKFLAPIYSLLAWFMFASILVASLVEIYYA